MKKVLLIMLLISGVAVGASTGYHKSNEIKIGGAGSWDYLSVDVAARRLYVSHQSKVEVIDIDAGKKVGEVLNTAGVHGIAVAPALNKGFVSDGSTNDVTVVDLKTYQPIGTPIKVGTDPDAILFEPVSSRVLAFNARSNNISFIDTKTSTVVATAAVSGNPEFAVHDGKGVVYDNIESSATIAVIDAAKGTVTKEYSIAPCMAPSGLAIDTKNRKLFSVCSNRMMVISDPDTAKVVTTVPIGAGPDAASFDPGTGLAFSSNGGDGTLTIVQLNNGKYEVVENLPTQARSRTMTLDEKTHNLFFAAVDPAPGGGRGSAPDSFKVLVFSK
jgi:YVTN family beta-propeller protein